MEKGFNVCRIIIAIVTFLIATEASSSEPVAMHDVSIGGFWREPVKRITEKFLPHCVRQLEAGGLGEDLQSLIAAGQALRGEPVTTRHNVTRWGEAYVYNTVEAICLALEIDPAGDTELVNSHAFLRRKLEEWIPVILAAQRGDGYTHAYSIVKNRPAYTAIPDHELYVMGYFIEMGIAHYRMTQGKDRRLYDAAIRRADHIDTVFGPSPKRTWKNGHAGLEMALCRLARSVNASEGDGRGERYLRLARHFIDHHHELVPSPTTQSDRPAVELEQALGHAVRATYLYTAMADIAVSLKDQAYGRAADRLWTNVVDTKLYVNGGVGAQQQHEAFGPDFFLPNHNGYSELCAACGMVFWATQMYRKDGSSEAVNVQERVFYNHLLGGLGLNGETFYYPSPMASQQDRYGWHVCPCCVGNIPRTLLAIKDLIYAWNDAKDTLYVNQYVDCEGDVAGLCRIRQETKYPWDGRIRLHFVTAPQKAHTLALRIPSRTDSALYTAAPAAEGFTVEVNSKPIRAELRDGYAVLLRRWESGDCLTLTLPLPVQRVRCDERVEACRGRVAVQRGPLIYNFESVDNGDACTYDAILPSDAELQAGWRSDLLSGVTAVSSGGLVGIPNYARLNRGGFSSTWLVEDPAKAEPFPAYTKALVTVSTFTSERKKPQKLWINDRTVSDDAWRAPQFDFHPNKGTDEWIQYTFDKPANVTTAKVWWFDEGGKGGCAVPDAWRITYQDADGAWKPVRSADYPIDRERLKPSVVTFDPVASKAFRLEIRLQPKFSGGVQEWVLE